MGRLNVAGYIKLDRRILGWGWYKDANTMRVFIHLLLTANYCEGEFMGVTIHRGEVATSYPSIGKALGLSVQNVRTSINHLKSTGEVTARMFPKFQVISIEKYDMYQTGLTGKPTGIQQAANSNIRNKEGKNGIEEPTWLPELCQVNPETETAEWARRD